MLAEYKSRLYLAQMRRDTRYDHVENCNMIHCDILTGIFLKNTTVDSEIISSNENLLQKLRSFVLNQHTRKQLLVECHCSTNIHLLLHGRYEMYVSITFCYSSNKILPKLRKLLDHFLIP